MDFEPGTRQQYCSTNYILLGLLLATHYHKDGSAWSWKVRKHASIEFGALLCFGLCFGLCCAVSEDDDKDGKGGDMGVEPVTPQCGSLFW